jgi:NADH-quinone oxidoreductase subunit G
VSADIKTVKLTIDGRPFEVDSSRTVLEVALEHRIEIPYFCYHPNLSVPGNCRQCQVKVGTTQDDGSVRWMPKLQVSCNMPVGEGMVIDTQCDEVQQAQKHNMEFLLINHPLDCPICDQVGECWLQEHAYSAGMGVTRFREEKVHFDKRVDVGPHVLLDKERCIQCTRCIRFCDEVTGTSELALVARGNHTEVDIFPGKPLDNAYSGNVVDICPVGALTLKEFRFKSRLWFLKTEDTVCPGCARGCNIKVWHRDNSIARITPRDNSEVNKSWMCDYGRLLGPQIESGERVREPRAGSSPATWEQALDDAAARLRRAAGRHAAVIHPWSTMEDGWQALKVLAAAGGNPAGVAVCEHNQGSDDDLLMRADKSPNRRGLAELVMARGRVLTLETLLDQAAAGQLAALLVLAEDLAEVAGEARLDAALTAGLELIVLASHESATTRKAAVVLPAGKFPEVDGTVVNVDGRVQVMHAAYPPPFLSRPAIWILGQIALRLGVEGETPRARDLFAEMTAAVPALAGLDWDALGSMGRPLPAASPAAAGEGA